MNKDAYYFSHDSNSRNDLKILAMRSLYGAQGYGWFWMMVEMMREEKDYKLKINKYAYNAFAMQMQCEPDAIEKFVSECINEFELFESDGEKIWSESLLRRMDKKNEKSEKAKKAAMARWGNNKDDKDNKKKINQDNTNVNANAMHTQCDSNAIKEKERKEKERKENTTIEESSSSSEDNILELDDFTRLARQYQKCIGMADGMTSDWLKEILEEYKLAWCLNAMQEANLNGKRTKKYVNGILSNWSTNGGMKLSSDGGDRNGFIRKEDEECPEFDKSEFLYKG